MTIRLPWYWKPAPYDGIIKVNKQVKVKATGQILTVTRIDRHVYPICAGYGRYKPEQLETVV